jgi:hemerythrin
LDVEAGMSDNIGKLDSLVERQHLELISLINVARRFDKSQMSPDTIRLIADRIIAHVNFHFECEEMLLEKTNNCFFNDHQIEHNRIREEISFAFGNCESFDLIERAIDVLSGHLVVDDIVFKGGIDVGRRLTYA